MKICLRRAARISAEQLISMQTDMQTNIDVEIVMLEKLDCILSKSATRPYIYEYKCECVRTHQCIDPSGRQQSPVIRDSPPAIRESSPAIRWQRPIMQ